MGRVSLCASGCRRLQGSESFDSSTLDDDGDGAGVIWCDFGRALSDAGGGVAGQEDCDGGADLRDAEIGVCKGGKGEGVEETQSACEGEIEAHGEIAKIAESSQNIGIAEIAHRKEKRKGEDAVKGVKKQHLPSKVCVTCGRPFVWRKKWERDWESVKYCSDRCRKGG